MSACEFAGGGGGGEGLLVQGLLAVSVLGLGGLQPCLSVLHCYSCS
jgi:hypothetical protein